MKIYKDLIGKLESELDKEEIESAEREAAQDIFLIKLAELRKMQGIRQNEIKSFSQSGISKLEARKDVKISTLIEYLNELGLGMEIKVYPKGSHKKSQETILVKV